MDMDPNRDDLAVGVAGAGAMGRGIAQVAAVGGMQVRLYDSRENASAEAIGFVRGMLERAAAKGRMSAEQAQAAAARIAVADSPRAFAGCDAVVEAVVEDLAVKQRVFAELEQAVDDDTVLATNTSSLSVTGIASACRRPERVAGMHFFNPVPLMKLVEVVAGVQTTAAVVDFLAGLGKRMGRVPVRVADAPGFLVNQVGRGFTIEAAHAVTEGVATFADVDRVMREAAGFRMGPFELMDLTALDVTHPATEAIYTQSFHEPRYRPSALLGQRMQAGLLGRKTGRGFYTYGGDSGDPPQEPSAPAYDGRPVWVSPADAAAQGVLLERLRQLQAPLDDGARPGADSLILVTPFGEDATTAATDQGLDPRRTLAVDLLLGLERRHTVMKTPLTAPAYRDSAHGLLARDGKAVTVINDSPGFVAQRVLAMIVNIGCALAQGRVATPQDVDRAVTLGLNYPRGPLDFGDALGPARVLQVLQGMHRLYGDPRYRPNIWLTRRARLGVSLLTPEN